LPVQVVAELDAFTAVRKGHNALAVCFGNREHVLQDARRALAEVAAPEKKGVIGA